jgi:hypothetical protein
MQRRKAPERTDPSHDSIVNPYRPRIPPPTMYDSVPDRIDLREPGQRLDHCLTVNMAIG